jgi:hypothetical protein
MQAEPKAGVSGAWDSAIFANMRPRSGLVWVYQKNKVAAAGQGPRA